MRHKSEVLQTLKGFIAFIEKQSGYKIKTLRNDNSKNFLKCEEINHECLLLTCHRKTEY